MRFNDPVVWERFYAGLKGFSTDQAIDEMTDEEVMLLLRRYLKAQKSLVPRLIFSSPEFCRIPGNMFHETLYLKKKEEE